MIYTTYEMIRDLYLRSLKVCTDSRRAEPGSIFFALHGDSFDGNRYARQALDAGCVAAVVDNPAVAEPDDDRYYVVEDALHALQWMAMSLRLNWGGKVVQVTGTNGKTTTKELLAAVLSRRENVLYTQGNLNNHIGVPLTLLGLRPHHTVAVVETGANHPGEIANLCWMVHADYGLVTNVGCAHLEGFGSLQGVMRTKGELMDNLGKRQAGLFLNTDDPRLVQMAQERNLKQIIPYVEGRVKECTPFVVFEWRQANDAPWHTVPTHLVGDYNVANLRAAVTVGLHFGVPAHEIDAALAAYRPTNSRSEWRSTGRNHLLVDAYNANPASMAAALANFAQIKAPHKMAILGDMRELGEYSQAEHQRIADQLATMKLDEVWLVGSEFARAQHSFRTFSDVEQVKAALAHQPIQGRTILVKGSNSLRLQTLPEYL